MRSKISACVKLPRAQASMRIKFKLGLAPLGGIQRMCLDAGLTLQGKPTVRGAGKMRRNVRLWKTDGPAATCRFAQLQKAHPLGWEGGKLTAPAKDATKKVRPMPPEPANTRPPPPSTFRHHACILAYLHTCILAYLHTCILAYLHTDIGTHARTQVSRVMTLLAPPLSVEHSINEDVETATIKAQLVTYNEQGRLGLPPKHEEIWAGAAAATERALTKYAKKAGVSYLPYLPYLPLTYLPYWFATR